MKKEGGEDAFADGGLVGGNECSSWGFVMCDWHWDGDRECGGGLGDGDVF